MRHITQTSLGMAWLATARQVVSGWRKAIMSLAAEPRANVFWKGPIGVLMAALLAILPFGRVDAAISLVNNWTSEYAQNQFPPGTAPVVFPKSYTANAGSNRVLVVAVASTQTTLVAQTAVSASYGGTAMNRVVVPGDLNTVSRQHTYLFSLAIGTSASSGAAQLNVSVTGATANYNEVYAAVYAGVDQTTPITNSQLYTSVDTNVDPIGGFATALTIATGDLGVEIVSLFRPGNTVPRTIATLAGSWVAPAGTVAGSGNNGTDSVQNYILVNPTEDDLCAT